MQRPRQRRSARLRTAVAAAVLAAVVVPAGGPVEADAAATLHDAWERVARADHTTFASHLTQTVEPAPAIAAAGRRAAVTTLHLAGTADRRAGRYDLRLWTEATDAPAGAGAATGGLELRIDGAGARARFQGGAWRRIDGVDGVDGVGGLDGLSAPAVDPAAILRAAANVRALGAATRAVPTAAGGRREVALQHFAFTVDGAAYAAGLRAMAADAASGPGALPAALRPGAIDALRDVAGRGEAWIDADGRPRRVALTLEYPQARDGTRRTMAVATDFTGFAAPVAGVGAWVGRAAGARWAVTAAAPRGAALAGLAALVVAAVVAGSFAGPLGGARRRRARLAPTVVTALVVGQLAVGPLVPVALAAGQGDRPTAAAPPARLGAAPAAARPALPVAAPASPARAAAQPRPADGPDADGDGLSDDLERRWGTNDRVADTDGDGLSDYDEAIHCPVSAPSDPWTAAERAANGTAGGCPQPTKRDTDGDGLTDGEEVLHVGTAPNAVDTDGDEIGDPTEVKGFAYGGGRRHTDARRADSDGDGLPDGLECPAMRDAADPTRPYASVWTPALACVDSGVADAPDVLNVDNDGDGVPNRTDVSPLVGAGATFDDAQPLQLGIDGLEPGKPAVIDLQVRPANASQLALAHHVLDWPTGDNQGQIQRRLDTTFGDTYAVDPATPGLRLDPSDPAFDGDVRLSPFLEITMPAASRDLPRTAARARVTLDDAGEIVGRVTFSNATRRDASQPDGLAIDGAQVRLDALVVAAAPLQIARGRCGLGAPVVFTGTLTRGDATPQRLTGLADLGALADGGHVARLEVGGASYCAPIPSLIEGETSITTAFQRTQPDQIHAVATVELAQDGPSRTQLTVDMADPTQRYDVAIRAGRCGAGGAAARRITGLQGRTTRALADTNAVDLADGRHVVALEHDGRTLACAPLGNIVSGFARGTNEVEMIDTARLAPYQITVHEATTGDLTAIVPLARTVDADTGATVAFDGHMVVQPAGRGPLRHAVRLLWLVSMVDDDGAVVVVQSYRDEAWHLTGAAVREEHGIDVAVVYEDPAVDARKQLDDDPDTAQHLQVDDDLWALATGLDDTFLGNRTNGAGARTMTVAEIARRWETQAADHTATQRWGIDADTLNVETFCYATTADLGALGAVEIPRILGAHFGTGTRDIPDLAGNPQTTLVPTLLVASEARERRLNLDAAAPGDGAVPLASVAGAAVTLTLDPARVEPVTTAAMSWKPYTYDVRVAGWASMPLDAYWDRLGADLPNLKAFAAQAAASAEGRYETAADVAIAQVAYARWFTGAARVVQIGPIAVRSFEAVPDDDELARIGELSALAKDEIGDRIIGSVVEVSEAFIEEYQDHRKYNKLNSLVGLKKEPYSFRGALGRLKLGETTDEAAAEALGAFVDDGFAQWKQRLATKGPDAIRGAAVLGTLVGSFVNAEVDPEVGVTPENAVGLTIQGIQALDATVEFYRIKQAFRAFQSDNPTSPTFRAFLREADTGRANLVSGAVGWIVSTGLSFGLFFEGVARSGIEVGGAAYNDQLVHVVAESVLDGVLAVLALTGYGTVAVAILSAIDSFVTLVCSAAPPDDDDVAATWACKGIQGLLGEALAFLIYDETDVVDLGNPQRLTVRRFQPTLDDPAKAFVPSATLSVTLAVRNVVTPTTPTSFGAAYRHQVGEASAKRSAFAYAVTGDPRPERVPAVALGDTTDWVAADGALRIDRDVTGPLALPDEAGINQAIDAWLVEGYEILVQQCAGLGITACWLKTRADDQFIDLGLVFDVLPATLDAFAALSPKGGDGGLALAWGQRGDLTFPVLADADGDGLHHAFDPDDATVDGDGDGVWDLREKRLGLDPRRADSDADGLGDADELRRHTDPLLADTDGDGLSDLAELQGWAVVYNTAGERTWVYPAPRGRDADADGIDDSREKDLGTSPWAVNDGRVLNYTTELREPTAPSLLMRFDEPAGATTIADTSQPHSPISGACAAPRCPVTGHRARIGNAALFDGHDDFFALGEVPEISALESDFLVSAWVMPARVTGRQRVVGLSRDARSDGFGFGLVDDGLILTFYGVAEFVAPDMAIPVDDWTWIAASVERVDGAGGDVSTRVHFFALRLAGDGIAGVDRVVTDGVDGARPDGGEALMIGAVHDANPAPGVAPPTPTEAFGGRIDEVVIVRDPLRAGDDVEARLRWQMLGIYNLDDGVVAPGQRVVHTTALTNRLLSKNVAGLLKVDMPAILTSEAPAYQTFALGPAVAGAVEPAEQKIRHPMTVAADAPSGDYDVGQDMAATIDRRTVPLGNLADADYVRSLLYDLDRKLVVENDNILNPSNRPLSAASAHYDGGDLTVAAWVNWKGQSWQAPAFAPYVRHGIMGAEAGRDQAGPYPQWLPKSTAAMSRHAFPSLIVEDGRIVFGFGCTDPDNGWCEATSARRYVTRGQDVHVAVSYDRAQQRARLYVDQVYQEDLAMGGMVPRAATGFVVGSANTFNHALRPLANRCSAGQGLPSYSVVTRTDDPAVAAPIVEVAPLGPPGGTSSLTPVRYHSDITVEIVPGRQRGHLDYLGTIFDADERGAEPTEARSGDGCASIALQRHAVMPFSGRVWDLEVYARALTQAEVTDLVASATTIARYKLDEVPGQTRFEDYVGGSYGSCAGATCPVAGLRGRENLAAAFDGVDDHIVDAKAGALLASYLATDTDTGYAMGAWVRPGPLDRPGTFLATQAFGTDVGELRAVPVPGKPDKVRFWFGRDDSAVFAFPATEYARDAWHHVLVAVDGRAQPWHGQLYVDGVAAGAPVANGILGVVPTIGAAAGGARAFRGLVDDVFFGKGYLDAAGVRALIDSVPVHALTMDDPSPAPDTWRAPLVQGQLNEARRFLEPSDRVAIGDAAAFNLIRGDFTIAAWVLGDALGGAADSVLRPIVAADGGAGQPFLGLSNGRPQLRLAGGGDYTVTADTAIAPNLWTHVAVRRRSDPLNPATDVVDLFVQGASVKRVGGLPRLTNPASPPQLAVGGTATASWRGRLDEVLFYRSALNDEDIAKLFNFQNTWIDERSAAPLTVDGQPPTAEFPQSGAYVPLGEPSTLAIDTRDVHSAAQLAVLELQGPDGATTYAWGLPCRDAVAGSVMCPSVDPDAEGRYRVTVHAVDDVGNVASVRGAGGADYGVIVDGTAPAVTFAPLPRTPFRPMPHAADPARWTVPLAGTAVDPPVGDGGDPGSGVARVEVTLFDANGVPLGDPPLQQATVAGTAWTLAYALRADQPAGTMTGEVTAVDAVGRRRVVGIPPFQLDAIDPAARLTGIGAPGGAGSPDAADGPSGAASALERPEAVAYLGAASVLQGTVDERPAGHEAQAAVAGVGGVQVAAEPLFDHAAPFVGRPLSEQVRLYLPFDRSDGAPGAGDPPDATYADLVTGRVAACAAPQCPVPGIAGRNGQALRFDGVDDGLAVAADAAIGALASDFTVAAWIRPAGASGEGRIVSIPKPGGATGWSFGRLGTGLRWTTWGIRDYETAQGLLIPGIWQHVAVHHTADDDAAFYVNGRLVQTVAGDRPPGASPPGPLVVGAASLTDTGPDRQPFDGAIDDVVIAQGALAADDWATALGLGPTLRLGFDGRHIVAGAALADGAGLGAAAAYRPFTPADVANHARVGVVGAGALELTPASDGFDAAAPPGVLPAAGESFAVALWIEDMDLGRLDLGGAAIRFDAGAITPVVDGVPYAAPVADRRGWHHVAVVWDAPAAVLSVFHDGVLLRRDDVPGGSGLADAVTALRFTHLSPTERYAVDDLRVYRRALPPLEVAALAAARWTDAAVAEDGGGAGASDRAAWSATLPAGLEGHYAVKVRGADAVGNVDPEPEAQWTGIVDTLAPRFIAGFAQPDAAGVAFELRFEDFNLDVDPRRMDLPGDCGRAGGVDVAATPYRAPWHLALAEQVADAGAAQRLRDQPYAATIRCHATYVVADETMAVCDRAGNCASVIYNGPSVGAPPPTATPGPSPTATATPAAAASPSATATRRAGGPTVAIPTATPPGPRATPVGPTVTPAATKDGGGGGGAGRIWLPIVRKEAPAP